MTSELRVGRVRRRGAEPGCARGRQRYRRCQPRRAHGGPPGRCLDGKAGAGGPPRSRPSGRASLTHRRVHARSGDLPASVLATGSCRIGMRLVIEILKVDTHSLPTTMWRDASTPDRAVDDASVHPKSAARTMSVPIREQNFAARADAPFQCARGMAPSCCSGQGCIARPGAGCTCRKSLRPHVIDRRRGRAREYRGAFVFRRRSNLCAIRDANAIIPRSCPTLHGGP